MSLQIAVIDDSQTMRDMVSYTLKEAGHTVVEAEDGKHALSVLEGAEVNVIITDLNMPNMDGITLIRELRTQAKYQGTPILMLTTEADEEKKNAGRAAGATGWIVKPFNPEKLLSVIQKVSGA